jgi:hypothetical protein
VESRVFRKIFGPKRGDVIEEWRRRHNEEFHGLYSLPDITGVIKSRRMRWVGCVACMWDRRGAYKILMGKPEGKNYF